MTDTAAGGQLFTRRQKQGHRRLAEPDWATVHRELKRKHVTLQIVWDEYIARHPKATATRVLRAVPRLGRSALGHDAAAHAAATSCLSIRRRQGRGIDFDRKIPRQIFVACWGASNFTYAERAGLRLGDWIGATLVPSRRSAGCRTAGADNTKSAVIRPALRAAVNRTYAEMAAHYDTAVLQPPAPARDKAKVEAAVLIIERWLPAGCPSPLL